MGLSIQLIFFFSLLNYDQQKFWGVGGGGSNSIPFQSLGRQSWRQELQKNK